MPEIRESCFSYPTPDTLLRGIYHLCPYSNETESHTNIIVPSTVIYEDGGAFLMEPFLLLIVREGQGPDWKT